MVVMEAIPGILPVVVWMPVLVQMNIPIQELEAEARVRVAAQEVEFSCKLWA